MDLGLRDRSVLVTGSTAGIGLAAAKLFASEGARVIVNGRTDERVSQAVAQIREAITNAKAEGVAADLSSAAGADTLIQAFPDVDVLVNNAGVFRPVPFEDIQD